MCMLSALLCLMDALLRMDDRAGDLFSTPAWLGQLCMAMVHFD